MVRTHDFFRILLLFPKEAESLDFATAEAGLQL